VGYVAGVKHVVGFGFKNATLNHVKAENGNTEANE
jgi:hypothetical protein